MVARRRCFTLPSIPGSINGVPWFFVGRPIDSAHSADRHKKIGTGSWACYGIRSSFWSRSVYHCRAVARKLRVTRLRWPRPPPVLFGVHSIFAIGVRRRVQLPPSAPILALRFGDVPTSYQVFVDGKRLGGVGRPGAPAPSTAPRVMPTVMFLGLREGELDIVLQVANFHHSDGGIVYPIRLGLAEDLLESRQQIIIFDFMLFGAILIMGCYHIGLFLLRRKDRSPALFAAFCFLIALRIMTTGERYLAHLFPAMA
jgi:7TM diverse intracellular signalling